MASATGLLLWRGVPLRRSSRALREALPRRYLSGLSTDEPRPPATASASVSGSDGSAARSGPKVPSPPPPPPPKTTTSPGGSSWEGQLEFRRWKDKEEEILSDIRPITILTKDILHSNRYKDGERLSAEDEKEVIEKLLTYHPHSEDKIGCGLDSIMVDRHPQFRNSRCLFVVRTDGGWIDFSYQKCLRAYIRDKYPSHAERFIRERFKRC